MSLAAPHVLMTADAVGGVWTYALELAQGLLDRGVRVTLAMLGPGPSKAQRDQAAALPDLDMEIVEGPLDWTADCEAQLAATAAALARVVGRLRPDLVHLNSPALMGLVDLDARVLGVCHSCTATWWAAVRGGPLPAEFAWRREIVRRGYLACDALVAPTQAFAEATAALYPVRPYVVHNGRRSLVIDSDLPRGRFALTAGRLWDEGKGLSVLERAARRIEHPVVALGPTAGPDGAVVRLERVKTPGPQSARVAAAWMAIAPVFVSTALYEPFGLAVLEAAQAGAALVLSDIATFRELWDGAAWFVAPGDAEGVAAAINALLTDEPWRRALADRATARSRPYTADAMTRGVLAKYAKLAPSAFARFGQEAA